LGDAITGQKVAYQRVSSLDQRVDRQLDGITVARTFTDTVSGKDTDRPQLEAMLGFVRGGDTVMVHSMDRLARNLEDLRRIVRELTAKGVRVQFLTEQLTFTGEDTAMATLLMSVMGAFAEFERALIRERQREGIELAKKPGAYHGRAVVGTPKTKRGTRLVPIDDGTVAILRRHREMQHVEHTAWGPAWNDAGLVFTREDGRPLRPEYATRHFQALSQKVGLPVIRLHDLRHTNASLALQAGVDMKVVSERLGHSQMSITADLYTHVNRGLGRVAAEQIAGVLRAPNETLPSAFLAQTPENSHPKVGDTDVYP